MKYTNMTDMFTLMEDREVDVEELQRLIDKGDLDVDIQDECGSTILYAAICRSSSKVVRFIGQKSKNINIQNIYDGDAAIHYAVRYGKAKLKAVLDCGPEINLQTNTGLSALHIATIQRLIDQECIDLLIQHGIDVNLPDRHGNTALHLLIEEGYKLDLETVKNVVESLAKAGADFDAKNNRGDTVFDLVIYFEEDDREELATILNEARKLCPSESVKPN